jgi:ABC-type multidrug transport system ATPase subunit
MSTYEDYLNWKNARYPAGDEKAAAQETVVEMEPVHPHQLKKAEDDVLDADHARAVIDREVKDSTFINLKKDSKPLEFGWRDVRYTVPLKSSTSMFTALARKTGEYKDILSKISGYVKPGEILFVMGPSGAGKSSMLDALADRVKLEVNGVQWLGGEEKTEHSLRQVSKYVQQDDCIMGALTVKEVLQTASMLYIADKTKRAPLIDAVIKMVGLSNQVDTKVGDVFFRGLSGGQKRRLSIAIELLAQPQIMFLDEPTSGLDSAAAFSILSSLRRVAKSSNVSLIITIHQPSELLFELGDNLLLLANGQQVFFGPIVGPGNVEEHFTSMGFKCPPRTSVADWLLDLVNGDFGNPEVVERCIAGWKDCPAQHALEQELDDMGVPKSIEHAQAKSSHRKPLVGTYATSQFTQTMALLKRGFINAMRAPAVIWLRFAMYFMLAILIGTVWLLLGDSAKVINDINGCLFYTVAFMIFMSISVLPAYLDERNQFVRERANNGYSVGSYIISHTIFELPFIFLLALVCSSTIYWLVGLVPDPNRFFIFVANLFMSLLVAESIMILISAIIPYFIVGIAVGAFLFGAFMCVMGYFVQFDQIGWWWKWMRYIAVHYYSFSTFMTNQYADQVYKAYCPIPGQFPCYPDNVDGNDIIATYDLESRIWLNFVVMVIMVLGIRTIAALWLHFRVNGKK